MVSRRLVTSAAFLVVLAVVLEVTWASVCTTDTYTTTYRQRKSTYKCGWWSWRRCNRYHTEAVSTLVQIEECCAGSYGHVETGCSGECQYESSMTSNDCNGRTCRDYTCDKSGFHSVLPTYDVHENSNDEEKLFTVNATCFVQFTCPDCSCTCSKRKRSISSARDKRATCLCSRTEQCTSCSVSNTDLFEVRNGVEVWRKKCESDCRDCTGVPGCLDSRTSYGDVTVTCTGTGNDENDAQSSTFSISVDVADEIAIEDLPGGEVTVYIGDATVGTTVVEFDVNVGENPGDVTYTLEGATSPSSGNELFYIEEVNGTVYIKVNADLSSEPSHTYTLIYCVNTRRSSICGNITLSIQTAPLTTPAPTFCRAAGAWTELGAGMDAWCQLACTNNPPFCPSTHCVCGPDPPADHSMCVPVAPYDAVNGMNNWCDWNCNTEYPVWCIPEVCECDPPVNYNVTAPWQKK